MKTIQKIIFTLALVLLIVQVGRAQTNKAYGNNMVKVDSIAGQPVFAIYSGDLDQDGGINIFDIPMLANALNDPFPYGYLVADINGDGGVDIYDIPYLANNINGDIFVQRP